MYLDEASSSPFMVQFVGELNCTRVEFLGGCVVLPPYFKTREYFLVVVRCQVSDADCDRNKDKQWLRYRVDVFEMLARLVTSVLGLPRCRGLDYVIEKTI